MLDTRYSANFSISPGRNEYTCPHIFCYGISYFDSDIGVTGLTVIQDRRWQLR